MCRTAHRACRNVYFYWLSQSVFVSWGDIKRNESSDMWGLRWSLQWNVSESDCKERQAQLNYCVYSRRKLVIITQTLSWFRFPIFPQFYFPAFKIKGTQINQTVLMLNFSTSPTGKTWIFIFERNARMLGSRGRNPRIHHPDTWWKWVVSFTNWPFKRGGKIYVRLG